MFSRTCLTVGLLSGFFFLGGMAATAQNAPSKVKQSSIRATNPASGEEMFNEYCAVCHGKSGKGDGPAATEFKVPPSNLTTLSQRHGGNFPEDYVKQVLREGPADAKAHGSKDMPIWGRLFGSIGDSATTAQRISNLSKYLESLQGK